MICPTCCREVPDDECRTELHPNVDLEVDPEPGVVMRGECSDCGEFAASFGFPPASPEAWTAAAPAPVPFDEEPAGLCALCGQQVKRSATRPWGRIRWTGWCPACRGVSWAIRTTHPRPQTTT